MFNDVFTGLEGPVGDSVVVYERPDILDGIEFWLFRYLRKLPKYLKKCRRVRNAKKILSGIYTLILSETEAGVVNNDPPLHPDADML